MYRPKQLGGTSGLHYRNEARCRWPFATPTAICRGRRRSLLAGQPVEPAVGIQKVIGVWASADVFAVLTASQGYADGKAVGIAIFIFLFFIEYEIIRIFKSVKRNLINKMSKLIKK